jgi:hypothetical protein
MRKNKCGVSMALKWAGTVQIGGAVGRSRGIKQGITEVYALPGYYAVLSGSSVPTFGDNLSVPSSRLLD